MKTVRCWNDLRPFGIDCLTGEACGLGYRILFDLTAKGKQIVEKALGVKIDSERWNGGTRADPAVASIMLADSMLEPIAVFALLESGCREVWIIASDALWRGGIMGFEDDDAPEHAFAGHTIRRKLAYRGTAGDRNVHMMSGRVS